MGKSSVVLEFPRPSRLCLEIQGDSGDLMLGLNRNIKGEGRVNMLQIKGYHSVHEVISKIFNLFRYANGVP